MLNKDLANNPEVAAALNKSPNSSSYSQIMQLSMPLEFETEVGGPFPAWLSLSVSPLHEVWYRDVNLNWQTRLRFQPVVGFSIGRHLGF